MFVSKLSEQLAKKIGEEGRIIRQTDLDKEAGVRDATVSEWMSGKPMSRLNAATLLAFCDYFQCEPWDLIQLVRPESNEQDPENKTCSTPTADAA